MDGLDSFEGSSNMPVGEVDLYQLLQVPPHATSAQIKQNFRKLALQWHPDKCATETCASMHAQLSVAYDGAC